MSQFPLYDYEIIMADNCSRDNTVAVLREIASADKKFKVILNASNFGPARSSLNLQQYYSGDCVIFLASDLEDPPELIADFLRLWETGKKMVIGIKKGSKENIIMRLMRKMYYSFVSSISEVPLIRNFTGFGLYDKSILDPLKEYYTLDTYFRGLVSEYGYDIAEVSYEKPKRIYGKSSYNFLKYFDYAMLAITSYSKLPIHIMTIIGFCLSGISLLIAFVYFVLKLLFWYDIPFGFAPLIIGLFFFSSIQIFFIGLIGEYISSILVRVSPKPLVIVREFINFEKDAP
jgi:glycosyltransferase involved in cell wall biosynthesis